MNLDRSFYSRRTQIVARELLGKFIVNKRNGGVIVAKIVETEAYTENDPACHANRGVTPRNKVMFGPGGYVYVYFSYGNHWLLNFVTGEAGRGEAVLIRAVEPIKGLRVIKANRPKVVRDVDLTNGPGKVGQALNITRNLYGKDLTSKDFYVEDDGTKPSEVIQTTRIGINGGKQLPYRFYIKDNPYVSRK